MKSVLNSLGDCAVGPTPSQRHSPQCPPSAPRPEFHSPMTLNILFRWSSTFPCPGYLPLLFRVSLKQPQAGCCCCLPSRPLRVPGAWPLACSASVSSAGLWVPRGQDHVCLSECYVLVPYAGLARRRRLWKRVGSGCQNVEFWPEPQLKQIWDAASLLESCQP